jgi:hypothetical protein
MGAVSRHFRSLLLVSLLALFGACSTLPTPKLTRFAFPKGAFVQPPKRAYKVLGTVRSKAEYNTLNMDFDETLLCKNFFNKAVADLVRIAKKEGADAVVDVRSVTFLMDGHSELHSGPECSDDGEGGQVLVVGQAVKWAEEPAKEPARSASPYPLEDLEPDPKLKPVVKKAPRPRQHAPAPPPFVPRPDQPVVR